MSDKSVLAHTEHHVAHHFDTAEQEFEAAKLGLWVFLVTEVLFFGALFVGYFIFRWKYYDMFHEASRLLSWEMGLLNTGVLITSSFTMVMGVRSAQTSERNKSIGYLVATLLLAGAFLVVKGFEYHSKIHHGLLPNAWFDAPGHNPSLPIFFGIYFMMTGIHGLHVIIGMGLIVWLIVRSSKGHFHSRFYTPVEMVGLYWHLVDLIWIFLFPLLYLIR